MGRRGPFTRLDRDDGDDDCDWVDDGDDNADNDYEGDNYIYDGGRLAAATWGEEGKPLGPPPNQGTTREDLQCEATVTGGETRGEMTHPTRRSARSAPSASSDTGVR